MHPALRFLRELPQGLVFLPQLGAMMEHSTLYKPGNNRAGTFTETPENLQCHRQKSEGSRNYLQTEGHSKSECIDQENLHPQKRFERSPES